MVKHLWESEDKESPGVTCWADFDPKTGMYQVHARKGEVVLGKDVPATWEPRFGIDVADMDEIFKAAEELSDELKDKG